MASVRRGNRHGEVGCGRHRRNHLMVQTVQGDGGLSSLLVLHALQIFVDGLCKHWVTSFWRLLSDRIDLHCVDNASSLGCSLGARL